MSLLKVPVSEKDHGLGALEAPLTIVEYGDYECPFSREAHGKLKLLRDELGSAVRLIYRHFPMTDAHPYALLAALSAEAAGQQGKFWEMHDLLYANVDNVEPEGIESLVEVLKLDCAAFDGDLENAVLAKKVRRDFEGGVRSGVGGTPSFFINGVRYDGPLEGAMFKALVEAA